MSASTREFRVTSVDYEPADLAAQVPFDGALIREVPGSDRPDYWLASLKLPLDWKDGEAQRAIKHIVISARYSGQSIRVPFPREVTVGIAYIIDESVLYDDRLDFAKCRYVAIGTAEAVHDA
jgi:hypothetical protein